MQRKSRMLLNYGNNHRIWPFAHPTSKELLVSVALIRDSPKPICKLFRSGDNGESWSEIADFYSIDKRNTTTGQPFVSGDGTIFCPVWNAGFYTHGTTWLALYKRKGSERSWLKVYEDVQGTYGKHFFEGSNGTLYIGVGVGGGGFRGRVSSRPKRSYLLKSEDAGETWGKILGVDYPTALYSGAVLRDKKILVAAREKKSLFLSRNDGKTWKEIRVGNTARSISRIDELDKVIVSSDSALFISSEAENWTRLNVPIRGLILRYPTWFEGRVFMSCVGWRGYVVSTDLKKWYLSFDVTKETGSNLGARMAILDDYFFIGDEANGTLIRIKLPSNSKNESINLDQMLRGNTGYLTFLAKYMVRRIMGLQTK